MIILQKRTENIELTILPSAGGIYNSTLKLPDNAGIVIGVMAIPFGFGLAGTIPLVPPVVLPLNGVYFVGVSMLISPLNAIAVQAFSQVLYSNSGPAVLNGNIGIGQYLYYAHPTSLNTPVFLFNGTTGGFVLEGTVNLLVNTISVPYNVWRTGNDALGNISNINVTHS